MKVLLFAVVVFAVSCKKENDTREKRTVTELLTGKEWILAAHGFDDNNNGRVDASENQTQDCQKDNSYFFQATGTGSVSDNAVSCGAPVNDDFEWKLLNNDTELEIDNEKLFITRLDEDELFLRPDLPGLAVNYILEYRY